LEMILTHIAFIDRALVGYVMTTDEGMPTRSHLQPPALAIVTELAVGDLRGFINACSAGSDGGGLCGRMEGGLSSLIRRVTAGQEASAGLLYLHEQTPPIVHRDVSVCVRVYCVHLSSPCALCGRRREHCLTSHARFARPSHRSNPKTSW
jgi:hypothetical protein